MDLNFAVHLLVLIATVELRSIEVYEDVDDTPTVPFSISTRRRAPNKNQRFAWTGTAQQDLKKWRYFQQQQVDAQNRSRNKYRLLKTNVSTHSSIIQKREVPAALKRPIIFLKPPKARSVNLGLNHAENLRLMRQTFGEVQQDDQIQALNSLLGKTPTIQLQGLQQLLHPNGYKPITEDQLDVANPHSHPNVRVEYARPHLTPEQDIYAQTHFKAIESQLNSEAHLRTQNALIKAQKYAEAEEEAQRHLVLVAQEQAEKAQRDALAEAEARRQAALATQGHEEQEQALPEAALHNGKIFALHPSILLGSKHVEDSEKAYGGAKDNLQYASQYAFGYRVRDIHTGNDFGHEEVHDGHSAKGNYHVLLPDGRLQHVQYWADGTGFHAKVTYDRAAQHPH